MTDCKKKLAVWKANRVKAEAESDYKGRYRFVIASSGDYDTSDYPQPAVLDRQTGVIYDLHNNKISYKKDGTPVELDYLCDDQGYEVISFGRYRSAKYRTGHASPLQFPKEVDTFEKLEKYLLDKKAEYQQYLDEKYPNLKRTKK